MRSDFPLMNEGLFPRKYKLNRVFQRDDMTMPPQIDPLQNTAQCGGLPCASRSCEKNETVREIADADDFVWQPQGGEVGDFVPDGSKGCCQSMNVVKNVDPKALRFSLMNESDHFQGKVNAPILGQYRACGLVHPISQALQDVAFRETGGWNGQKFRPMANTGTR